MAYNSHGKRIRSESLTGQVTTTAWDQFACTSVDELISAAKNAKSAKHVYNFDDIGNRKTSSERGTNSVYTASQLNQYTAVDDFTPTYDADGNETLVKTATGIWQVTYNGENRPVRWELVSSNSNTPNSNTQTLLRMSFDRMGRRVTKNDQRFVYDGYLQIADNAGNTYVWDCTEPIATRPLVWLVLRSLGEGGQRGTSVAYYTHDGNKNVSEVIASSNDVAAHYEYAPFGTLTVSRGASAAANPWRFSSEYAEDDAGTVYYNYRHYEPVTGRWMQRDLLLDEESLYAEYSMIVNMIVSYFDYLGLKQCCCKMCLYSATPKQGFNNSSAIAVGDGTHYGHTWVTKEDCGSPKDGIGPWEKDKIFSFGPKEGALAGKSNRLRFISSGVDGGFWDVDDYTPEKGYVVVKLCWNLDSEECSKLDGDITNPEYPEKFSSKSVCTSAATGFIKKQGFKGVKTPVSSGPVSLGGTTINMPNPKTLAKNMSRQNGTAIPAKKK